MIGLFILILSIVIFIMGIVLIIYDKKFLGTPSILITVSSVIILFIILNTISTEKKIILSEDTLEQISQINWSDEENLKALGFEKHNQDFVFYDIYSIQVSQTENIPKKMAQYKNYLYEFSEMRKGVLYLPRMWNKSLPVTRSYHIYIDNLEISMFEHESEDSPYVFSSIIDKITKRQMEIATQRD